MDFINITNSSRELFRAVNKMSSLLELHLSFCSLASLPPASPFLNITSLSRLYLTGNLFNSTIPSWLFNMSGLTEINLYSSSLIGQVPSMSGRWNLCKLRSLVLSSNYLTGDITEMIEAMSCSNLSLGLLDLSQNQLSGKLPRSLGMFNKLFSVDLSRNSMNSHSGISGPIPASIGNLSKLGALNLEGNMMNGTIPESIGQLTNLYSLHLLGNYWEGIMTNIHFNLTKLVSFTVSSKNNKLSLKVTNDWVPPFKYLSRIEIHSCNVGPAFPNWLRFQIQLDEIVLENAGISGDIPYWLYNKSSQIEHLNLSHNKISGYLPREMNFTSSNFPTVDLSHNLLKGSIQIWSNVSSLYLRNNSLSEILPTNIGKDMSHLLDLDLSNNCLNGSIPLSLNKIKKLTYLDLSNNYLTGEIPEFWMGIQSLSIIDLSNNMLEGGIPTSICSLPLLFILELSNNNLTADLSSTFQNCTQLKTLSLKYNRFFGSMPNEIANNIPMLSELLLQGNSFTGSIPEELCHLPFLHLLDLAENSISGSIPTCLGDVKGFKLPQTYFIYLMYSLTLQGRVRYTRHIELIPEKIIQLIHLGALNLSWNHLTGELPNNIGLLTNLESLDLSHNHLIGPIPQSMASMTFLSHLNLSYNNLLGQIPMANQFATFNEPSIYEGNPGLCGHPLPTDCSSLSPGNGEKDRKHEDGVDSDDDNERLGLYTSIVVGYITGFWIVCGSLVLKRSWRHAYFNFVYDLRDKLLILMAVNLARLKRVFGLERN
ncbi:putative non-specific serine/threonine protein kinase [Medicago truncatula]|uniref:Putative non-specific serine/threonine protein kinase n=1 Tax=Medicago truncatula TaxID=3880 RepID=A0A396J2W2_MEDTR|nr:putative non-specific serine/threonine protein kinase [Medicago truncatula]